MKVTSFRDQSAPSAPPLARGDGGSLRTEESSGSLVQDRPTLGRLPNGKKRRGRFGAPLIDFVAASVVLGLFSLATGAAVFPAVPVSPLLVVGLSYLLGLYRSNGQLPEPLTRSDDAAVQVTGVLLAAGLAWTASLMTDMTALAQVGVWAGFIAVDAVLRLRFLPLLHDTDQPERWLLVGDTETAERVKAYEPLRRFARVVATISSAGSSDAERRSEALRTLEESSADRVLIAGRPGDRDDHLISLVRDFRALGVPVSLLPRPLDLLEQPAATPKAFGGVPLIDINQLAPRDRVPYRGPDRRRDRKTKVSVVVPAMNEEGNIGHVLRRLPDGMHEVILVDGNSKDRTIEVAREAVPDIKVLTQSGRGKGDAFRTAFAAVTGNLIVMLDADGSADPAEIPRFVAALEGGADFAKGSRYLDGGGSADITLLRKTGNSFLSGTANALHGTHFTDLCYGYNAFWARCLPFISLDVAGFEVETLINLRVANSGLRVVEVPSYEEERISGESNLKTFRDGFRVLKTILSEAGRRRPVRGEGPVSDPPAHATEPAESPA